MSKSLPTGNFNFLDSTKVATIFNAINTKNYILSQTTGKVFEVDLEYPHRRHDSHNDFSFSPRG